MENLCHDNPQLQSRILKTELINWKDLQFIQQENFKEWSADGDKKLFQSILRYHFIDPFKVWQEGDVIYCLDGKHRYLDLVKIEMSGTHIPKQLPATFIDCKDKKEAAEIVLVYSSQYAQLSKEGFFGYIEKYQLETDQFVDTLSFPGIDWIQPFLDSHYPETLTGKLKEKPASLKITFSSVDELESAQPVIEAILKDKFPKSFYSVSCGEI